MFSAGGCAFGIGLGNTAYGMIEATHVAFQQWAIARFAVRWSGILRRAKCGRLPIAADSTRCDHIERAHKRAMGKKKGGVTDAEVEAKGAKEVPVLAGHFPSDIYQRFEIHEWRHASAILKSDFRSEWEDLLAMLRAFRLWQSWIVKGGGNKTQLSVWIDDFLGQRGWEEKHFDTAIIVDSEKRESPTHKVDCYKNRVAFEVEWNNKDPFFDRDLNNFRLLFDLRTISVGVIFTRCDDLQDIFNGLGRGSSYGQSTTHMSKILPKIAGGGGGGCPIIVIGITKHLYAKDC